MIVVVVVIVVTLGREITANAEHAATRAILTGWEIALGSAVECAAILDVLVARRLQDAAGVAAGNDALERIVSILVRLVQSIDEGGPRDKRSRQRSRGGEADHDNEPR